MIYSLKDFISEYCPEEGKTYELDNKYVVVDHQCYVTKSVTSLDNKTIILRYSKVVYQPERENEFEEEEAFAIRAKACNCKADEKISVTDSPVSAIVDYNMMKLHEQQEEDILITKALSLYDQLDQTLKQLEYQGTRKVASKIKSDKKHYYFDYLVTDIGYEEEFGCLDGEIRYEFQRILKDRCIEFRDIENKEIYTIVNLDNVESIQVNMKVNNRDAVVITTTSNKVYYIYKKHHKYLYIALETIYN